MANMIAQCSETYWAAGGSGQVGVKVLEPDMIDDLRIFVNGYEVDCSQIKDSRDEDHWIDISKVSRDGSNVIQVTGLDIFNEETEGIVEIVLE